MNKLRVRDRSWPRLAKVGLLSCSVVLALLVPGEEAYAGPVSSCPGVGVYSYNGDALVDTSTFGVECVPIAGAELSMNGATAPLINFGAPADGIMTHYTYDSVGQIATETIPTGSTTSLTLTMTYDSNGRLTSETTTPSGSPSVMTTYTYDLQGRLHTETVGSTTTTYTYDSQGRLSSETTGSSVTDYTYDTSGRTVTATTGMATLIYSYDALGRVTMVMDPSSLITNYTYDSIDDLLTETDPTLLKTIYQYDSAGDLLSSTDPNGNVTTYQYDSLDRLSASADGTGATTAFAYDPAPVPEPSSLMLIAGGLVCWFGLRRRNHRNSGKPPAIERIANSEVCGA